MNGCVEWHTGTRSRMILKDEDLTMVRRSEVGFKRVNTLAHYRVADGAVMSLVPRHSSTSCYDLSSATDRSSFQHRYGQRTTTNTTASTSSSFSSLSSFICKCGYVAASVWDVCKNLFFFTVWHLSVMFLSFITSDKGGGKCVCPHLSVCLSVSKITQKCVHGFGWNVACRQMSGHGQTD